MPSPLHDRVRGDPSESLRDWLVVLTSTVGVTMSVVHIYSMGAFILPIEQELGWSRAQISGALTVSGILAALLGPAVGILIDRVGSRRIAICGVIVYAGGLAFVSTVDSSRGHWWFAWAVVGLGAVLIKPTAWMAAIAGRFVARRGLAIALALCGTGIASATMPIMANALIEMGSWRSAYFWLAAGSLGIALPLVLLFFHDPAARNSAPPSDQAVPWKNAPVGITARQGLQSSIFWRMAAASLLIYLSIIGLSVHFIPILTSVAIDRQTAVVVAGTIGIASICGRILTGLLLDRYPGSLIGGISFALPIVACGLLLSLDGSLGLAVAAAIIIGFSLGAETDVVAYLASRYFGLRNYGFLFGIIASLLGLGAGVGPMLAGLSFDYFGSYQQMIIATIPAFAIGGILIGSLGPYPTFEQWNEQA